MIHTKPLVLILMLVIPTQLCGPALSRKDSIL